MIRRIYAKYSSVEVLKEKLKKDPYKCLCGIAGVGFKTADGILLDMEKVSIKNKNEGKRSIVDFDFDLASSVTRCLSCIIYLLEENESDGHTKMNLADLRKEVLEIAPACIEHFPEAIKSDEIYYCKDNMEIALSKTYRKEKYIADTIVSTVTGNQKVWNYDIEKYRNINGVNMSDEQMQALNNVCKYNISILNGAAGTGKTYSTQAIIEMLCDNNKSFRLFSPTGKAAKVLASYTKQDAQTVHRGLGYNPMGYTVLMKDENDNLIKDEQGNIKYKKTNWGYNEYDKLKTDIVVVDEFSMVDVDLFKHLIDAIDFKNTKLLMIGDNAQLCSVGCGNLLHDFMQSNLIPTVTLTKVFRYGEGGLMRVATDVRFCDVYLSKQMKGQATTFGNNRDYTFVDLPTEKIPRYAVALYKKLLEKGYSIEDIQVLTAKNIGDCGTVALNNMLQQIANPNCNSSHCMTHGETKYYEGDLVIQKVNNYKAKIDSGNSYFDDDEDDMSTTFIANGETGIIKQICNSYMLIDFDGVVVRYSKDDLVTINLGYSISIHKSQGSSIKAVILLTPKSHIFMLNSNLIYVGLTRMKEVCYHLGTLNSVNQAVIKKANLTRNTFMQDFLQTSMKHIS